MSDALTQKLKREFAARADSYMDSLSRSSPTPPSGTQSAAPSQGASMYDQFQKEQYPGWYDTEDTSSELDFINATGATLWSLADTATFSALGYGSRALGFDVEEHIDFDDPLAKWGS